MAFIVNYVKDTAAGYMKTGLEAGGTMAGNAVGGVGSMIENSGRSFGDGTVKGGISGVGNSINGYGAGIIGSMSADGPVNNPKKKTAVKPGDAKKVTGGPQKKALPASVKKPATPASKTGTPKSVGAAKPPAQSVKTASGKNTISSASRPKAGTTPSKPTPAKTNMPKTGGAAKSPAASKPTTGGKTRISAASRPKPTIKA